MTVLLLWLRRRTCSVVDHAFVPARGIPSEPEHPQEAQESHVQNLQHSDFTGLFLELFLCHGPSGRSLSFYRADIFRTSVSELIMLVTYI